MHDCIKKLLQVIIIIVVVIIKNNSTVQGCENTISIRRPLPHSTNPRKEENEKMLDKKKD